MMITEHAQGYDAEAPIDLLAPVLAPPTSVALAPSATHPVEERVRRGRWGLRHSGTRPEAPLSSDGDPPGPLAGGRPVVIANVKGGSHKTTTTLLLAAALAESRPGGVVAWDSAGPAGGLGHRAEVPSGPAEAVDVAAELARLRAAGVYAPDLAPYVVPQPSGFDVLPAREYPCSAWECGLLAENLSQRYPAAVVDTGVEVFSDAWTWLVRAAGRLVIPIATDSDAGRAAGWMCDHLEKIGLGDLVRGAVTVLTAGATRADRSLTERMTGYFGRRTASVVTVPFEPVLAAGGRAVLADLSPAGRRAWAQLARTVAAPVCAARANGKEALR